MSLIAGIDIETTGLEPGDHRIIEIYIGLWRTDGTKAFSYEQRIDPQRAIAADAQRVHGISAGDLFGKPIWNQVAPNVEKILAKASLHTWHNGDAFDGPFLDYELKRVNLALPARPSFDTMLNGRWAVPDGKSPNLQELCFACNEPYDPALAHAASYDVDRMMACFFKGIDWGFYHYPEGWGVQQAATTQPTPALV